MLTDAKYARYFFMFSEVSLLCLQTIKNDDLEEIRELGSGTYGAVYHGKWKGSDVAIKRIKASCFAGRPSERKRLVVLLLSFFMSTVIGISV